MHGQAFYVIPVGAAFIVRQKRQPVIETADAEVMEAAVDQRGQTDPAVTGWSEADEIGLAGQTALRNR